MDRIAFRFDFSNSPYLGSIPFRDSKLDLAWNIMELLESSRDVFPWWSFLDGRNDWSIVHSLRHF